MCVCVCLLLQISLSHSEPGECLCADRGCELSHSVLCVSVSVCVLVKTVH